MTDEPEEGKESDGEEKSFRERVEEIREKRAEEGEGEAPESPFGGGGGPGGRGGAEEVGNEELVREVRQLRDEMRDQTRALKRIADALEDQ